MATATAELQSAVLEHPYRERMWYLLVDGLHREGRRVEALRAANRLRSLLADLGLAPAAELHDLEQRILAEAHRGGQPRSARG